MKPVAILGSGPAGLLAAYAAGITGVPMAIFSQPRKSVIGGAQFLHTAIPELTPPEPEAVVTIITLGTEAEYRRKVYGNMPVPFTSFPAQDTTEQGAWPLTGVYDRLWNEFGNSLSEADVTPEWLDENIGNFSAVISAVPRPALCRSMHGDAPSEHQFYSQTIQVIDECRMRSAADNTIIYNGERDVAWYRTSKLFGHEGAEYSEAMAPPFGERHQLSKPIRCHCDCFPDVIRVGRQGQWKKGVLAHDGFVTTVRELHARGIIKLPPKGS